MSKLTAKGLIESPQLVTSAMSNIVAPTVIKLQLVKISLVKRPKDDDFLNGYTKLIVENEIDRLVAPSEVIKVMRIHFETFNTKYIQATFPTSCKSTILSPQSSGITFPHLCKGPMLLDTSQLEESPQEREVNLTAPNDRSEENSITNMVNNEFKSLIIIKNGPIQGYFLSELPMDKMLDLIEDARTQHIQNVADAVAGFFS